MNTTTDRMNLKDAQNWNKACRAAVVAPCPSTGKTPKGNTMPSYTTSMNADGIAVMTLDGVEYRRFNAYPRTENGPRRDIAIFVPCRRTGSEKAARIKALDYWEKTLGNAPTELIDGYYGWTVGPIDKQGGRSLSAPGAGGYRRAEDVIIVPA